MMNYYEFIYMIFIQSFIAISFTRIIVFSFLLLLLILIFIFVCSYVSISTFSIQQSLAWLSFSFTHFALSLHRSSSIYYCYTFECSILLTREVKSVQIRHTHFHVCVFIRLYVYLWVCVCVRTRVLIREHFWISFLSSIQYTYVQFAIPFCMWC